MELASLSDVSWATVGAWLAPTSTPRVRVLEREKRLPFPFFARCRQRLKLNAPFCANLRAGSSNARSTGSPARVGARAIETQCKEAEES